MKLYLDHQQRLNLIALMGMQKGTVSEIRALWKLQDRLELSDHEKLEIGYEVVTQNGGEGARWDTTKGIPPLDFEISDAECQRLRKIVEEYPNFQAADRRWIEPFLDQLPEEPGKPVEVLARSNA